MSLVARWWQRTDGEPGLSWRGAFAFSATVSIGASLWWGVRGELDPLGVVVCAAVGTCIGALLPRYDFKALGRRAGERDAERIRAWRRRNSDG
jgi:hypothetical protein